MGFGRRAGHAGALPGVKALGASGSVGAPRFQSRASVRVADDRRARLNYGAIPGLRVTVIQNACASAPGSTGAILGSVSTCTGIPPLQGWTPSLGRVAGLATRSDGAVGRSHDPTDRRVPGLFPAVPFRPVLATRVDLALVVAGKAEPRVFPTAGLGRRPLDGYGRLARNHILTWSRFRPGRGDGAILLFHGSSLSTEMRYGFPGPA